MSQSTMIYLWYLDYKNTLWKSGVPACTFAEYLEEAQDILRVYKGSTQ